MTLSLPNVNAVFFGMGIGFEIYFGKHFVFSPNFCPGLYYTSHGRNLGSPIEFRSALEMAYEWQNGSRWGLQFWHISNAGIGYRNPGENSLILYLAIPCDSNS